MAGSSRHEEYIGLHAQQTHTLFILVTLMRKIHTIIPLEKGTAFRGTYTEL